MVLLVFTVVSFLQSWVSSSTVVSTSVSTTPSVRYVLFPTDSIASESDLFFFAEATVLTGALQGSFLASFALGWGVTVGAGLASYPLDTIRRRMMMTSGGSGPHYKNMLDGGAQVRSAITL